MFGTCVWCNGRLVGGDIACYTSQEYDLSAYVRRETANELLVRVGLKETLPPESAVGRDQEKSVFIPGIWGDVSLTLTGADRIALVQTIPDIGTGSVTVRTTVVSAGTPSHLLLRTSVREREGGSVVAQQTTSVPRPGGEGVTMQTILPIPDAHLWAPDHPFLYEVVSVLHADGKPSDDLGTTFGMREFRVVGGDFTLNGRKILLRGGNIAFHRFLSDADRGLLPWDEHWIRKILIDIPRAHNFNFFRNHIGQMYNRWYDIADEGGMLLQNEWQFWTTTGTPEQITKEFTRWLQDNWNHPSIIIWDPLNECSDAVVQERVVPAMKALDPTRPWESVDFLEEHPYIYSLGEVLNARRFGFTRALQEIEETTGPTMINEFLWWWLDKENAPTLLTRDVVERWMGRAYTTDDLVAHQHFLAQELVELFRRMRVDAIQPFVYISNNAGPTGNWFLGNIADARPKPLLEILKNAFAPFGISIELWDRHFVPGEKRTVRLFVFNDIPMERTGSVHYGVVDMDGGWISGSTTAVRVNPADSEILTVQIAFPTVPGSFRVHAVLSDDHDQECAESSKPAFVVTDAPADPRLAGAGVCVIGADEETSGFLRSAGMDARMNDVHEGDIVLVTPGAVRSTLYQTARPRVEQHLCQGGAVVIVEPEYGVTGQESAQLTAEIVLEMTHRVDADKGGYDSYLFAEDPDHPLWNGIEPDHLKMFNGAYGGEAVSQHDVAINAGHTVLARCGLHLKVIVVAVVPAGNGVIFLSRLQTRGRLRRTGGEENLYARRPDPVTRRFLLNLLACAQERMKQGLTHHQTKVH